MNESSPATKPQIGWPPAEDVDAVAAALEASNVVHLDDSQDWSLVQRAVHELPTLPDHEPRLPEPDVATWFAQRAATLQPRIAGRPWWDDTGGAEAVRGEAYVPGPAQPPTPPPSFAAQFADLPPAEPVSEPATQDFADPPEALRAAPTIPPAEAATPGVLPPVIVPPVIIASPVVPSAIVFDPAAVPFPEPTADIAANDDPSETPRTPPSTPSLFGALRDPPPASVPAAPAALGSLAPIPLAPGQSPPLQMAPVVPVSEPLGPTTFDRDADGFVAGLPEHAAAQPLVQPGAQASAPSGLFKRKTPSGPLARKAMPAANPTETTMAGVPAAANPRRSLFGNRRGASAAPPPAPVAVTVTDAAAPGASSRASLGAPLGTAPGTPLGEIAPTTVDVDALPEVAAAPSLAPSPALGAADPSPPATVAGDPASSVPPIAETRAPVSQTGAQGRSRATDRPLPQLFRPPGAPRPVPGHNRLTPGERLAFGLLDAGGRKKRARMPTAVLVAAAMAIPVAGVAWWWFNPFAAPAIVGVVSAPKTTIVAPADGRISKIMVTLGARVQPDTEMLVIEAPPPDERKRAELTARLDNAHSRADSLDQRIAELNGMMDDLRVRPPDPTVTRQQSELRLRLIDMKAQKDTATSEARELDQNLADIKSRPRGPQPVKAGIDGMVWSIVAIEGADTSRGLPLVEIADCTHIAVSLRERVGGGGDILPGTTVKVRIGGVTTLLSGILRLGRGSMTRADFTDSDASQNVGVAPLQVELNRGELAKLGAASCPIGKAATILRE